MSIEIQSSALIREFLFAAALHQIDRVKNFIEIDGLHPDATYRGKPTAICYALLKPNWNLMNYLFIQGAEVNQADSVGMTPLHYAVLGGCEYCLSEVTARGAQVNVGNKCGKTPLAMTLDKPHLSDCREMLTHLGGSLIPGYPAISRLH